MAPELLLIDASNSIYRAFYALPALRSSHGVPTQAVLGFATMLQKVLREERPEYAAIVWDTPGRTRRHALYGEYKAQRESAPDDLRTQLPYIRRLVAGYRIAALEHAGEEADDVIGTLACRAAEAGLHVVIVSTDRDLMQLVSEQIRLLDTMRGRSFGPREVEEHFGVAPARMLDYRALTGDSSDNIPGVKGIGEKSAVALLQEYGDLDGILAAAGQIASKRQREALLAGADSARLSRELSRLQCDLPVEFDLEALRLKPADVPALRALFEELELRRLLEGLGSEPAAVPQAAPAGPSVELVEGAAAARAVVERLAPQSDLAVACALEPDDPMTGALVGLALATGPDAAWFLCAPAAERGEWLEALRPLLAAPGRSWRGGGLKDLWIALGRFGEDLPGSLRDVGIAAYLDDPGQTLRPEAMAKRYLGLDLPAADERFGRGAQRRPLDQVPLAELVPFFGARAAAAYPLLDAIAQSIAGDPRGRLLEELEFPLIPVLGRMELAGVRVDEAALGRLSAELESELRRIEQRVYQLAGQEFNIGSPKQLQAILFEKLALPPSRRTKTGFSTDEAVLEELALEHEIAREIVSFRHLSKLKGTYLDALPRLIHPETGRIHCHFNQAVASTGRLSTSNPNLQNIPVRSEYGVRIREAFVPAEDHVLVAADYSQIELRILAHFSGDPGFLAAFREKGDIHVDTAARVFEVLHADVSPEQRAQMKAVNFGILYGSSAFGLARQLGISQGRASEHIRAYFERYPKVREYLDRSIETARERGYAETLYGRRRYLPDLRSRNRALRSAAERMAMNAAIQGTAADLIKRAMVQIDADLQRAGGLAARMILQVHDELLFEVARSDAARLEALVADRMQGVADLAVPLDVRVGRGASWREAH